MNSVYPLLDTKAIIVFECKKEAIYPEEFKDLELWKNKEYFREIIK